MFCYIQFSESILSAVRSMPVSTVTFSRTPRVTQSYAGHYLSCDDEPPSSHTEPTTTMQLVKDMARMLMLEYHQIDVDACKAVTETANITNGRRISLRIIPSQTRKRRRPRHTQDDRNTKIMINQDCYVKVLLDYIHTKLDLPRHVPLDVCDADGKILDLNYLEPHANAKRLMENGKVYTLLTLETDGINDNYVSAMPLITIVTDEEIEFYNKLRRNSKILVYTTSPRETIVQLKEHPKPKNVKIS